MIEKIKNLPENVIGFNAKAQITGEDYEKVLIPMVEEKLKKFDKLNLLYHIGDEFEKFEPRRDMGTMPKPESCTGIHGAG